jgi:hypothetical protein
MPFIAKLPPVLIGMEACGGAHDWARRFREHGHDVKFMASSLSSRTVRRESHFCDCFTILLSNHPGSFSAVARRGFY